MIAAAIILALFGAGVGYAAQRYTDRLSLTQKQAMIGGAAGAIIGAALARFILVVLPPLLGAAIGVAALLWFMQRNPGRFEKLR